MAHLDPVLAGSQLWAQSPGRTSRQNQPSESLGMSLPHHPIAWQRRQGSGHQRKLGLVGPVTPLEPPALSPCTKDIFLDLGRQALAICTDGRVVTCRKQLSPAAQLALLTPSARPAPGDSSGLGAKLSSGHSRSVCRAAVSISRHLLRTASQVTGTGGNVVILGAGSTLGSSSLLPLERDRPLGPRELMRHQSPEKPTSQPVSPKSLQLPAPQEQPVIPCICDPTQLALGSAPLSS